MMSKIEFIVNFTVNRVKYRGGRCEHYYDLWYMYSTAEALWERKHNTVVNTLATTEVIKNPY